MVAALALATFTGCAHVSKKSSTTHERIRYGAAVPPDWKVVVPESAMNLPADETNGYRDFSFIGETNTDHSIFGNHPKIFVAERETWTDVSRGGGTFVFTDPQASQINSSVNNQAALAGGHSFAVGTVSSTITTNAVAAINSAGSAVGNVIGAAAKAASGTP